MFKQQEDQNKNQNNNEVYYGSITEQGNLGLGFEETKKENDKEEIKRRVNEDD